jgi:hypothetical protein
MEGRVSAEIGLEATEGRRQASPVLSTGIRQIAPLGLLKIDPESCDPRGFRYCVLFIGCAEFSTDF